jgi:hypothetical protein
MRSPLRASALVLFAASALVSAGCGGSDTSSATAPPSTAEEHKGGEASIEEFGSEASGVEREAIEGAFSGYLKAVGAKDYPTACSHLSAAVQSSLEQLVVKQLKGKGCAAILPKLLSPTAPQTAREQAKGQIAKVRAQGDRGFVVFRAPGAKLYQQTMVREGGEWKVATVAASVLVPEL